MKSTHPDKPNSELEHKRNILFRFCAKSDLQTVQKYVDDLYSGIGHTSNVKHDVVKAYREFESRPEKGRIIVCETNGKIIGYCIIIFFWSNEYGGNIIDIDEIYVNTNCRNTGIGTKLLQWVENTFADNLVGFRLEVDHHNLSALRLYERLGFLKARRHFMTRML